MHTDAVNRRIILLRVSVKSGDKLMAVLLDFLISQDGRAQVSGTDQERGKRLAPAQKVAQRSACEREDEQGDCQPARALLNGLQRIRAQSSEVLKAGPPL